MDSRLSSRPARRLCLLAAGWLLGAGCLPPARAAAPANPELDGMISRLPDPSKWKESPLQGALDPANHDPDLLRVNAALRAKQPAEAARIMRAVAARYPTHADIQFVYGRLSLLVKSYAEAERAFRAAAGDSRLAAPSWYFVGAVQLLQNRSREGAASLRQCLRLSPPAPLATRALTLLAYYDRVSGANAEASKASQQAIRLSPADGFAWTVRGYCEAADKHYEAAIADYQKAISLDHRMALAYWWLGIVYAETNRVGEAIGPLKTSLALAPGNYFAATQLGYCYLRSGQAADGARVCRQTVLAHPDFSKAWDLLGLCCQQLGKKREALDAFRQAVKTGPENTVARAHLDEAARTAGGHA